MISFYRGFSLVELMIVITIVAILSLIAYPSYQQYLLTTHRVEAKKMLLDVANRQESYFMDFSQYASSATALSVNALSESGFYQLSVSAAGNTFTLSATAVGNQASDLDCTRLSINETGVKSASGAASSRCWD
ncbi:type IV pilin protein [Aeromonas cavernicola]|uniref:Prepilin-type cleavage/methylation domain-containing protein n=1 Tax=Aeromonas cavernicola TaxID=1006623 RepID=A0A2H9U5T3_9GAMM|nr:type IV pilin protein [Aeromonas cavernicola]PJG59413.1 prepilin-type cleavage/methylation domain-containing protein [Aeromonas cavernicola]